jgi:DNA-binding transcriptional regulator YiaG
MSMNFPQIIKALREKNGWTQKDLAGRCGVSHRTVENWEQNRTNISGPALVIVKMLLNSDKEK